VRRATTSLGDTVRRDAGPASAAPPWLTSSHGCYRAPERLVSCRRGFDCPGTVPAGHKKSGDPKVPARACRGPQAQAYWTP
jgi:hypothetical protein